MSLIPKKLTAGRYVQNHITLGDLKGNRFTITIRDVDASDELIEQAMIDLKNFGFINYFGKSQ